jgi:CBS domain-containing protein
MIKINEAMEENVIFVKKDDTIADAAKKLTDNNISGAPVINGEDIVGLLSEGDIMDLLEVHSPKLNLVMPSPLDIIEMPVRMKHEYDELAKGIEKASLTKVEEIMSSPVITIGADEDVADAAHLMEKEGIKRIPVLDDKNEMIGIITRRDIVKALVNHQSK